jgi:hypothetical protein
MERGKTTPLYLCCCPIGKLPGNYIGRYTLSLSFSLFVLCKVLHESGENSLESY